jgi:hypothetical protein
MSVSAAATASRSAPNLTEGSVFVVIGGGTERVARGRLQGAVDAFDEFPQASLGGIQRFGRLAKPRDAFLKELQCTIERHVRAIEGTRDFLEAREVLLKRRLAHGFRSS